MTLKINNLIGFAKGGGPSFDSDAAAFFTAAGITDATQRSATNQLVIDLKAANIWSKCVAIYPFVGGSAAAHKWNLKDPRDLDAAFRIVFGGTVTHNANGATPNGTTGFGDTKISPATHLTANNVHLSFYSRTNSGAAGAFMIDIGSANSGITNMVRMGCRFNALFAGHIYNAAAASRVEVANADGRGFYIHSRRANNDAESYKNGSSVGTNTNVNAGSAPSEALSLFAGLYGASRQNFSDKNCAFASAGSGLTDAEAAAFNTAVELFQDTLGRGVV